MKNAFSIKCYFFFWLLFLTPPSGAVKENFGASDQKMPLFEEDEAEKEEG